jgi:hypothetical protein
MSKKEKALPRPKKTPFGRSRHENEGQDDLLMADRMAMAAAEGRLNEYLDQEMPEGPYAKKLANMMMGMTGILPPEPGLHGGEHAQSPISEAASTSQMKEDGSSPAVPQDVVNAVQAGDVEKLKELLAREKQMRSSDADEASGVVQNPDRSQSSPSMIEKDMLDSLMKVAFENKLSIDWLMARALKLYLEEYRKTGRL